MVQKDLSFGVNTRSDSSPLVRSRSTSAYMATVLNGRTRNLPTNVVLRVLSADTKEKKEEKKQTTVPCTEIQPDTDCSLSTIMNRAIYENMVKLAAQQIPPAS